MVVAAVAACGIGFAVPPHPDPDHYDRHCTADEDCVLVFHKDCTPGDCQCGADGSINKAELERFNRDEERSRCYESPPVMQCDCAETRRAVCRNGTCEIGG